MSWLVVLPHMPLFCREMNYTVAQGTLLGDALVDKAAIKNWSEMIEEMGRWCLLHNGTIRKNFFMNFNL